MKLLAPNGKPTNLTPEQYKLVRTPAFKAWFGDWAKAYETGNYDNVSRVIDEETKEPLIVFHGTDKEFNVFLPDYFSSGTKATLGYIGFYFTDDKSLAIDFTRKKFPMAFEKKLNFKKGARVLDVFLNIRNPKYLSISEFFKIDWENRDKESILRYKNKLIKSKIDGIIIEKAIMYSHRKMREFDGKQYIILQNNKNIKLADGTNTTFDSNNPDIRFEGGGKVELNKNFKKWFDDNLNKFSVNNKGVPTIWYHARSSDFNTFKKNYAYFAETETYAGQYGDVVQPFYVKCKKTLNLEFVKYDLAYRFESLALWIEEQGGKREGKDYEIIKNTYSKYTKSNPDKSFFLMWEFFSQYNPLAKHFIGWLKKYFDSIYYWEQGKITKNNRGWNKGKILYVFGNEIYKRIKLADGTNTTFDSNNPDIRFDDGGIFHGSPHKFERFTTDMMGSGEGNLTFGWGLYFTDKREIAEHYKSALEEHNYYVDGNLVTRENSTDVYYSAVTAMHNQGYEKSIEVADDSVDNGADKVWVDEYKKTLKELKNKKIESRGSGYLYEVSLHKGKSPEQYDWLIWDKPVSENQSEKILIKSKQEGYVKNEKDLNWFKNHLKSGSMIYDWLRKSYTNKLGYHVVTKSADKEASLFLLSLGIDGIKYPAESTTTGETSDTSKNFNYVVFDENAVSIYGIEQYDDGGELEKLEINNNDIKVGLNIIQKKWGGNTYKITKVLPNNTAYVKADVRGNYGGSSTAIRTFEEIKNNYIKLIKDERGMALGFDYKNGKFKYDDGGELISESTNIYSIKNGIVYKNGDRIGSINSRYDLVNGKDKRVIYFYSDKEKKSYDSDFHFQKDAVKYTNDTGLLFINDRNISFGNGGELIDESTGKSIKKVYVSIRIPKETGKVSGDISDFENYFKYEVKSIGENPFKELKEHKLNGILGVSSSDYNVNQWLVHRDCLVLMPINSFIEQNKTEQVKYTDVDYLTKDGLEIFYRLYDRKDREPYDYYAILQRLFPKIQYEFTLEEKSTLDNNKRTALNNIATIFDIYWSSKFMKYLSEKRKINSLNDFSELTLEYLKSDKIRSDYSLYDTEYDINDLIEPIKRGIVNAAKIYADESEWLILDKQLKIPNGSQLFFVLGGFFNQKDKIEELISKYNLRDTYKISFIEYKNIENLRQKRASKQDEDFKERLENSRKTINYRLKKYMSDTLNDIVSEIDEKWEAKLVDSLGEEFRDDEGNEYNSVFGVPKFSAIHDEVIGKFIEIYENEIPNFIENKDRFVINSIFSYFLKYLEDYISQNDEVKTDITESRGYKISIYELIQPLKYIIGWDIDYKKYTDKAKVKLGSDLYRFYGDKEINFKDGGQTKKTTMKKPYSNKLTLKEVKETSEKVGMRVNEILSQLRWNEGKSVLYPITENEKKIIQNGLPKLRKEKERIYNIYLSMKDKKQSAIRTDYVSIKLSDVNFSYAVRILGNKYILNFSKLNNTQRVDNQYYSAYDLQAVEKQIEQQTSLLAEKTGDYSDFVNLMKLKTDEAKKRFDRPQVLLQFDDKQGNLIVVELSQYLGSIKDRYADFKVIYSTSEFEVPKEKKITEADLEPIEKQAIKDVLTLDKYSRFTEEEAEYLYGKFKNYEGLIDEYGEYVADAEEPSSDKDIKDFNDFMEGLEQKYFVMRDSYDEKIEAYQIVINLVDSVRGRMQTLLSKKSGVDLFPETDTIIEPVNEEIQSIKDAIEYFELEAEDGNEEAIGALEYFKSELESLMQGNKYAKGGEIKYFEIYKEDKPILKVKFKRDEDDSSRRKTIEMLDKLSDRGYNFKEVSEAEYKKFDYSKVDNNDVVEFMSNSEHFEKGGKIKFNKKKVPSSRIYNYALKIKTKYPKIWSKGGNIFGNQAFKNLERVIKRGYWLESEKWMFIKWQSYVARHHKDYRIEGTIAMLKWLNTTDKGWDYMKDLIEEEIKKQSEK